MATIIINGKELEIGDDERLNGIEAAKRVGDEIPHYCWHKGLTVVASCRMCLVEVGKRNAESGEISMMPKLVPACQTPATDGTVFVTESDKVERARAMVEEDLLLRHPVDCPICDKAGECLLQDYYFKYGQDRRRADIKPFHSRRRDVGPTVTLFVDRCVMCSRCVRFTREVSGTSELMVSSRGAKEEIDVFPGYELNNKLAGNVVDLCPVGALGDKDFLYQQRVWFMNKHENVCAGCSTGCSIFVEENQDHVYRLKPRENPHVNQWWMCDEGRYGYHHIHDEHRVHEPKIKNVKNDGGDHENIEWSQIPAVLSERLAMSQRPAIVLSPHLTVEEAYLAAKYFKQLGDDAAVLLGHVPVEGEDETFPGNFTIRAEKCPNRKGVETIAARFHGSLESWEVLEQRIASGDVDAVWLTGGYRTAWVDDARAEQLRAVPLLIVQDMFPSPLWNVADFQLPGPAFAEREGSYVNIADRLQSFRWAVRPPAGVMTEGQLFWRLLGEKGMYNGRKVLDEVAREIAYFGPAAEPVGEVGVDLKATMLAQV